MRRLFFLSVLVLILSGCSKSYEPEASAISISTVKLPAKAEAVSYDKNDAPPPPPRRAGGRRSPGSGPGRAGRWRSRIPAWPRTT